MIKLRDFQVAAITATMRDYFKNNDGDPIIALPTGTGKGYVIAGALRYIYYYQSNARVLMVTHVKELVEQNHKKLLQVWTSAPVGVYSAGLGSKDLSQPIIFAGIQSIGKKADQLGHIDLIFVDECHSISPKESTLYGKLITELREANPNLKVVGLTATPYRLGQGMLTEQPSLFTDISFDMTDPKSFKWLIKQGYLAPLVPKPTKTVIDLSGVKKRGGEFIDSQLQRATDREEITWGALHEALEVGHDRNHWLIFATGIEHAKNIHIMLKQLDISAGIVHSKMSDDDRDAVILDFKNGTIKALVNVGILTTGFDFEQLDLILMLRATCSPGLWVQMLGRGTRPAPGKKNCMVLDFARNTERLGPIDDPIIPKKKGTGKRAQPAPIRTCEECNTYIHASLRVCPHCGTEIPITIRFDSVAGDSALLTDGEARKPEINNFDVSGVTYRIHTKQGAAPAIKITYRCGLRVFNMWACLFHEQPYPRKKALDWWFAAQPQGEKIPRPENIMQAMESVKSFRIPSRLSVQTDLKYPEIVNYYFGD